MNGIMELVVVGVHVCSDIGLQVDENESRAWGDTTPHHIPHRITVVRRAELYYEGLNKAILKAHRIW